MLYGVDIHGQYQAGIDFPTLKAQGYAFAVTKASQGTSFRAPRFVEWIGKTRAAGLIPGAYHWIERGNPTAQCDHFLNVLAQVGGPDGLLIQLDCEDDATWSDVQAWVARWSQRTKNHPLLIYSGAWWWNTSGRRWPGSTLTPYLWHSHYLTADTDSVPDNPAAFAARIPATWWKPGYGGWAAATILQFTSKGDAGRLANKVDLNATKLTRAQLLALTRPPAPPAIEEDDMPTANEIAKAVWEYPIKGTGTPDRPADRSAGTNLADLQRNLLQGKVWAQSPLAALQALAKAGGLDVDEAAIAAGVLAGLTPELAKAIPADLAAQVVDVLGARLTPTT